MWITTKKLLWRRLTSSIKIRTSEDARTLKKDEVWFYLLCTACATVITQTRKNLRCFGSNASGLLQMLRAKGSTTMAPPYLTEKLSKAVKCAMRWGCYKEHHPSNSSSLLQAFKNRTLLCKEWFFVKVIAHAGILHIPGLGMHGCST